MHHIVFLDRAILPLELKRPSFPHAWIEYPITTEEQLGQRLREATIVISSKVPLRRPVLENCPDLQFIAVAGTGYDGFDLEYCRSRGIPVSNVHGYAEHTVAEHAFMLMLALARALPAYRVDVQGGRWQKAQPFCLLSHPIIDMYGKTLGVIGEGVIGGRVAQIAAGFGMRVLFADHAEPKAPGLDYLALDQLLEASDVVSLHCPLTADTRNLIGEPQLKRMKRTALLINTARGGLVDEAALAKALRQGWIAGAGIDVLSHEPPRHGNVLLELDLPNLIVTPHVAWGSQDAMEAFAEQLVGNLEAFAAGRPRNLVT
ncbi:MAG TPA: D-2-hydroxyacid dehydrogenase [Burkholderiales bacterium]|nr:D-2-hydroxyacid dehydrogenase [Burkholderiales bacterium]